VPVSFTGGFHPLPRAQFALALPLGAEAEGEWLDLEMAEWQDPSWVRERLQAQLPPEFALTAVHEVPVSGPSLSQELAAASWRMELAPESGATHPPTPEDWQAAAAALLASDSWVWHDTDKKGRPRSRECRPDLLQLVVCPPAASDPPGCVALLYTAAIDPAGRSLRPDQLLHWFQQELALPLQLQHLRRQSLQLRQGPS
jgi:radical SAM-linked protein